MLVFWFVLVCLYLVVCLVVGCLLVICWCGLMFGSFWFWFSCLDSILLFYCVLLCLIVIACVFVFGVVDCLLVW